MESVVVTAEFWRNRRIFLTGHTGFKGSWLALLLNRLGAYVTGYALPAPAERSLFELAQIATTLHSVEGDVRDGERLRTALRDASPDIVLHLAAQSLVRLSYSDPVGTFATNVAGTANLLDACRSIPSVRSIVVVTSDKCYEEDATRLPYKESDPLGGHDPYSASKACAEIVTTAYRRSFFGDNTRTAAIATARAGNVIGGGDWAADRLVPDLIEAFRVGKQPLLRNPTATRPWQHVLDPLWGYLLLAQRLYNDGQRFAQAWNFGPASDSTADVKTVAERVAQLWGTDASWAPDSTLQPREAAMLALDATKAQQQLGWKPALDLNATLAWTVSWYQSWSRGGNARDLTRTQIQRFIEGQTQ